MSARKLSLCQHAATARRGARHLPRLVTLITALAMLAAIAAAPNAGLAARQSGGISPLGDFQPGPAFAIVPLEPAEGGATAQAVNDAGDVVGRAVGRPIGVPNDGQFAAFWHGTLLSFVAFEFTVESDGNAINASGHMGGHMVV